MVVSLSVVLMLGALLTANFQKQPAPAAAMAEAANAFSTTLTDAQRDLASFSFDDAERLNWHYILASGRDSRSAILKETL